MPEQSVHTVSDRFSDEQVYYTIDLLSTSLWVSGIRVRIKRKWPELTEHQFNDLLDVARKQLRTDYTVVTKDDMRFESVAFYASMIQKLLNDCRKAGVKVSEVVAARREAIKCRENLDRLMGLQKLGLATEGETVDPKTLKFIEDLKKRFDEEIPS